MTASKFLNSKEVGSIYLHEDSVPNMAGSRGCFKKKLGEKGGKRKKNRGECTCESEKMSLYTAGVMKTDNAVQAVSSCQILLLQASVFSRVIEKQGLLQHQNPKPKSCFWKSNRERQADVALLGCSEAGLGSSRGRAGNSSNRGYCNS